MLMAVVPTHAEKWSAENILMVHLSNKYRYVSDPDGIMSRKSRQKADSLLRKLDKECGVESAFIIVNNVEGGDPFRVAQDVGNKYGIGKKATNRGLVVVIAVKDRKYFIAPGEGLEKDLTDAECDKIAKVCIVENMRDNKPGEAVVSTARAIYSKMKTGDSGIEEEKDSNFVRNLLILAAIIGASIFFRAKDKDKNNRGRGGRRRNSGFSFWGLFSGGGSSSGGGSYGGGSFGGGGSGGSW